MYQRKTVQLIFFMFPLFFFLIIPALSDVEYQSRGNRYEGIKPKPVSGYNIELISALVDYREKAKTIPEKFKVKFYLQSPADVYLTVRELDYDKYYWMDRVQPPEPWRPKSYNNFGWPTREVIQKLDNMKMYDLGVVVRLEREEPSILEKVAPVIFYHSQLPDCIKKYRFTFKIKENARLDCSVYKDGCTSPVFNQTFSEKKGGRPFTIRVPLCNSDEGWYRLIVDGYFLHNNESVAQSVLFYHKPVIK